MEMFFRKHDVFHHPMISPKPRALIPTPTPAPIPRQVLIPSSKAFLCSRNQQMNLDEFMSVMQKDGSQEDGKGVIPEQLCHMSKLSNCEMSMFDWIRLKRNKIWLAVFHCKTAV